MINQCINTPAKIFGLILFICLFSLAAAFSAEAFFSLEPCELCIYQRYPFALGIIFALFGLAFQHKPTITKALLGLCSLNFLVNSGIALYHTGVEQKWWESKVEGCSALIFENTGKQSILENIMSAPMGDCSKIPWQDPLLGLSMANYNIILCFALFVFCAVKAISLAKRPAQP